MVASEEDGSKKNVPSFAQSVCLCVWLDGRVLPMCNGCKVFFDPTIWLDNVSRYKGLNNNSSVPTLGLRIRFSI